jgi:hypothetical protein
MKTLFLKSASLIAFLMISNVSFSQEIDLALAGGKGFSPAISYSKLYGKKFKIGYGVRLTSYNAGATESITAPAKLTAGKQSIAAFLESKKIISQLDTFKLNKVQTNALNLAIYLQYSISKKIDLGFNIDAVGFTFGGKQTGVFNANQSDSQGLKNKNKTFSAKPTAGNLLLISDSDMGSLNSELYGKYHLNEQWSLRAGLSFQFVEYKSSENLAFNNNRFRAKVLIPFGAVAYRF